MSEAEAVELGNAFLTYRRGFWNGIAGWPLAQYVNQIDRNFKPVSQKSILEILTTLRNEIRKSSSPLPKDLIKLNERIDTLIFNASNGQTAVKPNIFLADDPFAEFANAAIESLPEDSKPVFYKLMTLAQKASGSKPSAKYTEQSKELIKEFGADRFKKIVVEWFDFVSHLKERTTEQTHTYGGRSYTYQTNEFITVVNLDKLKGFVWMCQQFHDTKTLYTIAALAERSFKKIPGKGPTAAALGNACLYTLYKSKGLEGISHLSRLKLRIKQSSTQNMIEKFLQDAAQEQGVSVAEIEDLAVDDFGLINGQREYEMEGYRLRLKILTVGDVELTWFKPDGTTQKGVPTVVKDKQAARLKKAKDNAKQIQISLVTQRDRMDRLLRTSRVMTADYFSKHFINHGLMRSLLDGTLWEFESDDKKWDGVFHDGVWKTIANEEFEIEKVRKVTLWHPVNSSVDTVRRWREYLLTNKIAQPFKQAFREIYLLTDAEINTKHYSNRMAAHILKQHQFNSLAKTRGWKYSLLGAYDDGRSNETAQLNLPDYKLRAEFWVNEINADNAFNDTGIWNYVATDQVRFVNTQTNESVDLIDVPAIPFSEVMRDADLFVGVASVGNDPTWNDSGGVPAYRDYWQSYSFGDLNEIGKTRKETLARLLPRLKIAPVAVIKDRFLVVKGTRRTYKIHIGSTNILMEPNDQYLCIVPDRSQKVKTDSLFLPFEGDTGFSVLLSKAFLLAEDDKITDTTILSQIGRK